MRIKWRLIHRVIFQITQSYTKTFIFGISEMGFVILIPSRFVLKTSLDFNFLIQLKRLIFSWICMIQKKMADNFLNRSQVVKSVNLILNLSKTCIYVLLYIYLCTLTVNVYVFNKSYSWICTLTVYVYVRWQCMSMYSINRIVGYVHW